MMKDITPYKNDLVRLIGYTGAVDTETIDMSTAKKVVTTVLNSSHLNGNVGELTEKLASSLGIDVSLLPQDIVRDDPRHLYALCTVVNYLVKHYDN